MVRSPKKLIPPHFGEESGGLSGTIILTIDRNLWPLSPFDRFTQR